MPFVFIGGPVLHGLSAGHSQKLNTKSSSKPEFCVEKWHAAFFAQVGRLRASSIAGESLSFS
jgi:hypothetical protein